MEIKTLELSDISGGALANALVYIYVPGTKTIVAGLVDGAGVPMNNPFRSGANGEVEVGAPDGEYDLVSTYRGRVFKLRLIFADANPNQIEIIERSIDVLAKDELVFRKSISGEVPLLFPGYADAFIAAGSPVAGYLYPQGHCYDAAGRLFIKYANGTAVIAWYEADLTFGGWFLIAAGGESLVIIDDDGGRKLYSKAGAGLLNVYDITAMPTTGSTASGASVGIAGVGLQYAYSNGRWVIEQLQVDVGIEASRTTWAIYDSAFNKTGEFFVAKNVVGWQLSSSALYNYVPKSQGVALRGDKVLFGLGGSYIPETDGAVAPVVAATGVASCNLDGSLSAYGTIDANKLITKIIAGGHLCVRTESEGLSVRPDGSISHLIITVRPSTPGADSAGVLLYTELDQEGQDYSSLSHPYTPFNMDRTFSGVFPRDPSGTMANPFTGAQFTSVTQILQYMSDVQAPRFCWYTSAVTITPIGDILLPTAASVEILNQNNETFIIRVSPVGGDGSIYGANLTLGIATRLGSFVRTLKIDEIDGSGNSSAKIRATNRSASDADLLPLNQQSTAGGNLLNLGGGSSLFYAASRLWVWIGATLTTKTGTKIAEFFTNGINPGTDILQSLGTASLRWLEVFAFKGTFSGPVRCGQYTLATLPDATVYSGYEIDVTNATGGPKRCRSDGTAWKILNTTTTVS